MEAGGLSQEDLSSPKEEVGFGLRSANPSSGNTTTKP